jgi:hypothetical protein
VRKRILVAVGVLAVVVAVPVFVAAATPSATIKPAVTAKLVNLPDDKGGLTKTRSRSSDDATTPTTRREAEPATTRAARATLSQAMTRARVGDD